MQYLPSGTFANCAVPAPAVGCAVPWVVSSVAWWMPSLFVSLYSVNTAPLRATPRSSVFAMLIVPGSGLSVPARPGTIGAAATLAAQVLFAVTVTSGTAGPVYPAGVVVSVIA